MFDLFVAMCLTKRPTQTERHIPPNLGVRSMCVTLHALDLEASDKQSDTFLKKINRARFALARTDSVRSVSGSVYAKVPYRRAASVPLHLLSKTLPNNARGKIAVDTLFPC